MGWAMAVLRRAPFGAMFLVMTALAGCSGQISNANTGNPADRGVVYPITSAEADQAIAQSMQEVFPSTPITPVALPHKGYMATISFLADSHRVTAVAVPAAGRVGGGTLVDGYSFDVSSYGSMPLTASSRAQQLFAAINRRAAATKAPVPAAQ